ncbi:hypothetical protein FEM48_Zijuj03G0030900 [Ziziphus jujuba var. spinosa]|uniref:3-oxo-5-alpha-steroid 4-dehydrogenase C-terminal domain-containing protein n=1 Tax=Ziziphus jujuba var. spinosa TaxID=714518 RepID=A0A978VMT4_ZIZJJ|nr:hypothetical protein FEM48_Zijuj03G0030900 [Ziziphus jujuba var. spinosa]
MMLLQWFIFPPPPSVFIKAMSVISLTSIAILGFSEMRGKHLNYSKFWNSNSQNSTSKRQIKLSGRAGMLLLYTPAFLAAFISLLLLPHHHIRFVLLNSALTLHFFKRIFEVLFVHRFSSDMVLNSAIVISLSYFSSTSTMIYAQKLTQGLPEPPIDLMYFGIVLFLIGIFGNFYHHYILSNLRGTREKEYKIPKGAFLVAFTSLLFFSNGDIRVLLLKYALALHFFKRIFEVLFVHRFSGQMVVDSAIVISLTYFSSTATMIYTQHLTQVLQGPPIDLKYIGVLLFLTGICGNFYHHYLLSQLRGKGEKEYKIPKGGLFGLVIGPHYLFKIIAFVRVSFISQTVYAFCFTIGTLFYLMGRSYATRRWYLSKFEDFPQHVKALLPYVF